MEKKLAQLKTILNEVIDLKYAQALLGWDQETYMPPGGAVGRGYQAVRWPKLPMKSLLQMKWGSYWRIWMH